MMEKKGLLLLVVSVALAANAACAVARHEIGCNPCWLPASKEAPPVADNIRYLQDTVYAEYLRQGEVDIKDEVQIGGSAEWNDEKLGEQSMRWLVRCSGVRPTGESLKAAYEFVNRDAKAYSQTIRTAGFDDRARELAKRMSAEFCQRLPLAGRSQPVN
jgi:hypothetical protein